MLWSNFFRITVTKNHKHIYSNIKKKTIQKLIYAICMLGGGRGEVATKIVAYKEFNIKLGNF
jgi:hypothetical protein